MIACLGLPLRPRRVQGPLQRVRFLMTVALLCAATLASAQPRTADPAIGHWEADAVRRVWTYLNERDCAGAVKELNGGLSNKYAVVMVMAGAMYEDGLCLKKTPERAITMFERAYAAGRPLQAGGRLTALYAAPGPAQDKAAALWWAKRSGQTVTEFCGGGALALEDAEAFVKVLAALPPGLVDACTYVAGVVGMIHGDTEFPSRAASFGMRGAVQLVFHPAVPRFEVKGTDIGTIELPGLVNGDALRDGRVTVKNEFVQYMEEMTQRALRRFPKPETISPTWKTTLDYSFHYQR